MLSGRDYGMPSYKREMKEQKERIKKALKFNELEE